MTVVVIKILTQTDSDQSLAPNADVSITEKGQLNRLQFAGSEAFSMGDVTPTLSGSLYTFSSKTFLFKLVGKSSPLLQLITFFYFNFVFI